MMDVKIFIGFFLATGELVFFRLVSYISPESKVKDPAFGCVCMNGIFTLFTQNFRIFICQLVLTIWEFQN